MKSNCLFFAVKKWFKNGGFIVIRKSKYGNWSHVMWTKDFKKFEHFVPENHPLKFPLIHKIYFSGIVKIVEEEKLNKPPTSEKDS